MGTVAPVEQKPLKTAPTSYLNVTGREYTDLANGKWVYQQRRPGLKLVSRQSRKIAACPVYYRRNLKEERNCQKGQMIRVMLN